MDYEIVTLEKKIVVGYSAVTGNTDPEMGAVISELWVKLYGGGEPAIAHRVNDHAIGLYSDYTDERYTVTAGCEVSEAADAGPAFSVKLIPAGRYAKFSVHGHMTDAVSEAWSVIWQTDLPRSFTGDFEEYTNVDEETGNADIDIFIALK